MTALVLDCDGVIAETERTLHLPAFNRAFEEFGLDLRWSEAEYGEKLIVAGGRERISASLGPGRDELAGRIHSRKSELFAELLAAGELTARPGIARIVREALEAGWGLAVASTSTEVSVRGVLGRVLEPELAEAFIVVAGDDVPAKKPDPAIYELAVERLGATPSQAVAIEDSRIGLLAATRAGLSCVVTVSSYTESESFLEAQLVVSSLGDPGIPARVIANRAGVSVGSMVTLDDLGLLC